jgi:Flp pilus assembly protein TadD
MNGKMTMKFAVSALALGTTMVACAPSADAFRPASAAARPAKAEKQASDLFAKAQASAQRGAHAEALVFAERAVELSPRDVGYRMMLADLYLKNGRFASAETTFGDVLALDPSNARAAFSVALARLAVGNIDAALAGLDELAAHVPAGDIGLAYALAGRPERAVEILESAARAPGANGRVRQNLALAYAFAGDWQKAKVTAAQDVSPSELSGRLEQWASLARPSAPHARVAAILGVSPAADPGQPLHLALAPASPQPTALAAAEPAPAPAEPAPAPVEVAAAEPVAVPASVAAPEPVRTASADLPQWVSERSAEAAPAPVPAPAPEPEVEEVKPVYAQAVESLVRPQPSAVRASAPKIDVSAPRFEKPRAVKAVAPVRAAGNGRFAVQLGAFSSAAGVERAWASAYKRYGFSGHTPLSTTVRLPKGTFHRLSVAGFSTHSDASRVCATVRAKGGACFVRAVSGDAPVQWAWRYGARRG